MPYIGKSPSAGVRQRYQYTATAGQTTFSGTDLGNLTLTYTDNNFVDVFQNGVLLKGGGTDYTATSGTSVVLATGASVSDVIEIIVYDVFSVGNFFNRTDSDSRYVNHNSTTAGTDNFIAGNNAGDAIASGGNYNTLVGNEAGTAITTGDNNTAVGFEALATEDAHGNNTAVGYRALKTLDAGAEGYNTAVGQDAGTAVTTGRYNTLMGAIAADSVTEGERNTALGYGALQTDTKGARAVALGFNALGTQNFTSATSNYNIGIGYDAGGALTTGQYNTFIGGLAGDGVDDADYNTAVGYNALSANCGQLNTAVGADALESCTGTNNTAVGYRAGEAITTGSQNAFFGTYTGDGGDDSNYNTAIGYGAMSNANFGDGNTSVGWLSGFAITGSNNTVVGNAAGYSITSGGNNLFLGKDAGRTGSPGGNFTTHSNRITLGDENIIEFNAQVSLSVASDERDKTDFTALDIGLDFVKQLNPLTYRWDKRSKYGDKYADDYDLNAQTPDGTHKEEQLEVGFKAQEVNALEEASGYKITDKTNLTTTLSEDGKQYGMQYEKFVPILVKAVQELSAKNDALEARIKKLEDG